MWEWQEGALLTRLKSDSWNSPIRGCVTDVPYTLAHGKPTAEGFFILDQPPRSSSDMRVAVTVRVSMLIQAKCVSGAWKFCVVLRVSRCRLYLSAYRIMELHFSNPRALITPIDDNVSRINLFERSIQEISREISRI